MVLPVIKDLIYPNEMIQYLLENTGGSSQKETGKKREKVTKIVILVM